MEPSDSLFLERLNPIFASLGEAKEIVLSTSAKNRVTSRIVSCACNREEILFLSWEHHTKCQQIKANPLVALCHKNLQIEGRAEILGNPLDSVYKSHADTFRKIQPVIFDNFSKLPGMVIVRITITSITAWTRDAQGHCIDHFDLEKKEYRSVRPAEKYDW
jgi:general stress protein 26